MSKRLVAVATFVAFLCIVVGAAYAFYILPRYSVDGWDRYVLPIQGERPADVAAKMAFLSDSLPPQERYEGLFRYFAAGALTYLSPQGAHITYPGAGSVNGYQASGLEGFARTGSLLAAWVASGRGDVVIDGRHVDLVAFLRRGILAGTDPDSAEYWGQIDDYNVRIVEAADIARILWMTRNEIWNLLPEDSKAQIAAWLLQVGGATVRDNNWLLFPVTVATVMRALGRDVAFDEMRLYEAFKNHYLGYGWFYDWPGVVDYYNVWGMTYELFWITLIDQQFDRAFIREAIEDSARLTAHLIGPQGYPVMGRSICYRTAVPAPLVAQALLNPDPASAGLARRAVDAIWRYFVARGVLQAGTLTQGYFRADLKLLDNYSGPGSCHWGLRSLTLAFLSPRGSNFWTASEVPLPVEVADYRLVLGRLGWVVEGNKETQEIKIEIPANGETDGAIEVYAWWRQLSETLLQRPNRPHNRAAKYERRSYSSAEPFFGD